MTLRSTKHTNRLLWLCLCDDALVKQNDDSRRDMWRGDSRKLRKRFGRFAKCFRNWEARAKFFRAVKNRRVYSCASPGAVELGSVKSQELIWPSGYKLLASLYCLSMVNGWPLKPLPNIPPVIRRPV